MEIMIVQAQQQISSIVTAQILELRYKIATLESKNRDLQNEIKAMDCTIHALRNKKSEHDRNIPMVKIKDVCQRCGCAITGTGLCKKCSDIVDKEAKE